MDPEYIGQPWSTNKIISVIEHLWVPVVVIGTSGTAGMIRRLRANMLDELQKQYFVTVSGSAIVSMVLSLPTTGPMLISALQSQDMYLAGSFLIFLALLTVVGMFLSDIALAYLDPRIRLGGSAEK